MRSRRPSLLVLLLFLLFLAPAGASRAPRGASTEDPGEALREAARAGDVARVKALLDGGVPVDSPAPRHGHTPLLFATDNGHTAVVELLVARGADVNARERFFHSTPLLIALEKNHRDIALLLLSKGAVEADAALQSAVESQDVDLAQAALATGRITPLDLKTARRQADAKSSEPLKKLLAGVAVTTPKRPPYVSSADGLKRCEGKYRTRDGAEMAVAVVDGGLKVTAAGQPDLVLKPVAEGRFESADGGAAMLFAGRADLIEWVTLNRDGEITQMGPAGAEPQPMKVAASPPAGNQPAPRGEPLPWPQFRGPRASGIADDQGVAVTWSVPKNDGIRFRTPVPGMSLSSPVIWGNRIFITTAVSEKGDRTFRTGLYGDGTSVDDTSEHSFRLLALDSSTGSIVWDREVHRARPSVRRHLKSSLANATPATDGHTVVVLFGAVGVLAAYDFDGKQLWSRDVGVLDCNDPQSGVAEWGHASSPVLHAGMVLIQADRRRDSFVAAYRLDTGEPVWRVARDETSTWTTPNILPGPAGDELITNGRLIRAYDPKTGALLWSLGPNSEVVVATPIIGDGRVFLTAGYPPVRPIYAVRPGHRGDLSLPEGSSSSEAIAWSLPRGGTYIPTPILYRGLLYTVNNNGLLTCYEADTGRQLYQTRLGEMGASFSASPVAADGRLYFAGETGDVFVLRAGAEYELIATNPMDEVVMATPAASAGLLVVRTLGHVVGIGAAR